MVLPLVRDRSYRSLRKLLDRCEAVFSKIFVRVSHIFSSYYFTLRALAGVFFGYLARSSYTVVLGGIVGFYSGGGRGKYAQRTCSTSLYFRPKIAALYV